MEIVARASIIFFFLLVLTRGLKRRTLGDMAPFEMLLLVTLGDIVQQGIAQEDMSLTGAILAVSTFATMTLRLQAFLDELGPNPLSDAQRKVADAVEARKAALVEHSLGDLQQWQTQLRALANHLEDLEVRARRDS